MVLTILATGLASFYLIARIKASVIEESCKRSSLHAQAFADHVDNSLNLVVNLADFLSSLPPELDMAGAIDLFRQTLHQAPFIGSVSLLEANGRVSASSHPNNVGLLVETEGYLQYSLAGDYRLAIGLPLAGWDLDEARQANSGNPSAELPLHSLPVIQRFIRNGTDISLLTVLNLDVFAEHFTGRLSVKHCFVEHFRNDQLPLLSSAGPAKREVGAGHGGGFSQALAAETLRFGKAQLGQGKYFSAVRPTGQHPLVVAVRLDRYTALAGWRDERRRLPLVIVPALAGMVLLATALYRYQQRAVIEREEAKQQEHGRLATSVFDTVAEAVMVTGPDQLILAVNPAFTRITGYGGDEFVVLLPNLDTEEDALAVAEKLRRALYRPFQLGEHLVQISSSSGIALYPEDGRNEAENCCVAPMRPCTRPKKAAETGSGTSRQTEPGTAPANSLFSDHRAGSQYSPPVPGCTTWPCRPRM